MALQSFRRPNRGAPSVLEAAFLEKSLLSLPSLEFGIPVELASSDQFVVESGGNRVSAVYSWPAFHLDLEGLDPEFPVDFYVLPHLPLREAHALQKTHVSDAPVRIANLPRLQAKLAAFDKLKRERSELIGLRGPVQAALNELVSRRTRLARILDADADGAGNADFGLMLVDDADAEALLARWEQDVAMARAAADAARRRVIMAVHHAARFRPAEEGMVTVGENLHDTILHLSPDVHNDIYAGPERVDPCLEPPQDGNSSWERRNRSTEVALSQLMVSIRHEMSPAQFVNFSLMKSRRELIECVSDITRKEHRIHVIGSLNTAIAALRSLQNLDEEELGAHSILPTLLGNQVSHDDEELPMDVPFYPEYELLSPEEVEIKVRNQTTCRWS